MSALGSLAGLSDEEAGRKLQEAQREYVDARAGYCLKNSIVEDVVQSDPMVKAVHSGANASPMERSAPFWQRCYGSFAGLGRLTILKGSSPAD